MAETFNKMKSSVSESANSISIMIAKNKTSFIILTTIIYITILFLISKNDLTAHTGMYQGLYIFLAMLGFFLIGMIYLWGKSKDSNYGKLGTPPDSASWTSMLKKSLALVTFFGVTLGIILFGFWAFGNVPTLMNGIVVSLNFAIFVTILGLIYYYTKDKAIFTNTETWKGLITNIIFYIPCIFVEIIEWFKYQYKITTRTDVIMLSIAIVLFLIAGYKDKIYDFIFRPKGKLLLNNPVYLNNSTTLGGYLDLNNIKDDSNEDNDENHYNYHYAISAWIYINYQGANTNPSYSEYTPLLSYGNKPNILYNGLKNTLKITMQQGQDGIKNVYKTTELKMNKWNHFLLNYTGGTLDTFINGELRSSEPGVIPYMEFDTLVSGSDNGIHGGICNVQYFKRYLQIDTIRSLYTSFKDKTPPII
tara:strand:- start:4337 stop:5593 length:1257 start_codon:yes stop_codon:yes gene_type:complete